MKRAPLALLLTVPLLIACGGEESTICDEASRHLAACLGTAPAGMEHTGCEGRDADLASELLALSCSGIQSLVANTGTPGKADENSCLAPWDCPEQYEPTGEGCSLYDMAKCQGYCDDLYADDHMRLRKVSCELLEGGVAHCQCKGYWLPWAESNDEEEPTEEPPSGEEQPPEQEPEPEDDPFWS